MLTISVIDYSWSHPHVFPNACSNPPCMDKPVFQGKCLIQRPLQLRGREPLALVGCSQSKPRGHSEYAYIFPSVRGGESFRRKVRWERNGEERLQLCLPYKEILLGDFSQLNTNLAAYLPFDWLSWTDHYVLSCGSKLYIYKIYICSQSKPKGHFEYLCLSVHICVYIFKLTHIYISVFACICRYIYVCRLYIQSSLYMCV